MIICSLSFSSKLVFHLSFGANQVAIRAEINSTRKSSNTNLERTREATLIFDDETIVMLNSNKLILNSGILQDLQILIVDNDRDNRDLYAFLLESCGARVITAGSVKDGLASPNKLMPRILICEMRVLSESAYPLIRRVRHLALKSSSTILILITSTCPIAELTQQWKLNTGAYLLKPVNLEGFIDEVWNLTQGSRIPEASWLN